MENKSSRLLVAGRKECLEHLCDKVIWPLMYELKIAVTYIGYIYCKNDIQKVLYPESDKTKPRDLDIIIAFVDNQNDMETLNEISRQLAGQKTSPVYIVIAPDDLISLDSLNENIIRLKKAHQYITDQQITNCLAQICTGKLQFYCQV